MANLTLNQCNQESVIEIEHQLNFDMGAVRALLHVMAPFSFLFIIYLKLCWALTLECTSSSSASSPPQLLLAGEPWGLDVEAPPASR